MVEGDLGVSSIVAGGDACVVLDVDEAIYCREAVLRTAYWFTDKCYLFVARPRAGSLRVWIRQKSDGSALDDVAGAFANALLDHQLRVEIGQQSGAVRDLIVAKAFTEGGVLDDAPVGDVRDPVERGRAS